jgi:4-carboxymuconolactone decarboxylase
MVFWKEATMARIKGLEPHQVGWSTRLVYWFVRRSIGKITGRGRLVEPVKVAAHHPRLLKAIGQMEMGQAAATSVPAPLKALAGIKAATLVGCPF